MKIKIQISLNQKIFSVNEKDNQINFEKFLVKRNLYQNKIKKIVIKIKLIKINNIK